MTMFILGTIFGAGLILAIQTIHREWNAYNQRRWIRQTSQTIALLDDSCSQRCHATQAEHDMQLVEQRDELHRWMSTKDTPWA